MFPIEETDDILLESYEDEISDALPDITRARASVHRGAAYLQEDDYPPGGASAGQDRAFDIVTEGSAEEVMEAADDSMFIFGSYGLGCDVLGAWPVARSAGSVAPVNTSRVVRTLESAGAAPTAVKAVNAAASKMTKAKVAVPQRAGIVKTKTPGGRTITSLRLNNANGRWDPNVAIKNAKDAAARAINVGKKLKAASAKLAKQTETKLHGAGPIGRPPKVKVTPAQLARLADRAIKAGQTLQKHTAQFQKGVQSNEARIRAGVSRVRTMTKMRGIDDDEALADLYGEHLDQLTKEIMAGAADLLMEEMVEEVFGQTGHGGQIDETGAPLNQNASADSSATGGASPYDPADPTYGLGPPPTKAPPLQEGVDYVRDPGPQQDINVYSSDPSVPGVPLPMGAIIYDGTQPFPWQGVGSYTRFYGKLPDGKQPDGGPYSGYQWGGGNPSIMDGWYLWWASAYHDDVAIDLRYKKEGEGEHKILGTGRARSDDSVKHGWGPLIGKPEGWTRGLRYDAGGNQWFWYYDQAPAWAKAAGEQLRLNQAILEYKAALTAAQAEAAAKALADQAEQKEYERQLKQQAKEDAEYQRQLERERQAAEQQAAIQALEQERYDRAMAAQQERDLAANEVYMQRQEESALRLLQAQEEAEMRRLERIAELAAAGVPVTDAEYSVFDEEIVDLPPSVAETVDEVALAEDEVLGSIPTPGTLRGSDRIRYRRDVRRGDRDPIRF